MLVVRFYWMLAMPNYRRALTPGGTWFFTVNLLERRGNDLLARHIDLLRACVAAERSRRPFAIRAWVVLPEHMHWMWTLPVGDADFPTRWRRIKADFSSWPGHGRSQRSLIGQQLTLEAVRPARRAGVRRCRQHAA